MNDFKKEIKTILITGDIGFIGSHLSKKEVLKGNEVIGIDNCNEYYDISLKQKRLSYLSGLEGFRHIYCDIQNKTEINNIFSMYKPNIVVNLAAQAGVRYSIENPQAYIASNIIGFFNILEACRKYPVKHLVYASSSSVYGNNKKVPFSVEDNVDHPISLYAATKKADELMAYTYSHLYGIPATGLRFFTVYGPWGRPDMAYFSFTKKILNGERIQVFNNGDLYRDFTYIDDIVEGIMNVIPNPPKPDADGVRHKVYNIGNNQPVKLIDFIHTLEEVIGKKAIIEYKPMQPGDVYMTYADVDDLMRDFNFKPNTSLKDGLTKFVEWYKDYYNI